MRYFTICCLILFSSVNSERVSRETDDDKTIADAFTKAYANTTGEMRKLFDATFGHKVADKPLNERFSEFLGRAPVKSQEYFNRTFKDIMGVDVQSFLEQPDVRSTHYADYLKDKGVGIKERIKNFASSVVDNVEHIKDKIVHPFSSNTDVVEEVEDWEEYAKQKGRAAYEEAIKQSKNAKGTYEDAKLKAKEMYQDGKQTIDETSTGILGTAKNVKDSAMAKGAELYESAKDAAFGASEKVDDARQKGMHAYEYLKESAKDKTDEMLDRTRPRPFTYWESFKDFFGFHPTITDKAMRNYEEGKEVAGEYYDAANRRTHELLDKTRPTDPSAWESFKDYLGYGPETIPEKVARNAHEAKDVAGSYIDAAAAKTREAKDAAGAYYDAAAAKGREAKDVAGSYYDAAAAKGRAVRDTVTEAVDSVVQPSMWMRFKYFTGLATRPETLTQKIKRKTGEYYDAAKETLTPETHAPRTGAVSLSLIALTLLVAVAVRALMKYSPETFKLKRRDLNNRENVVIQQREPLIVQEGTTRAARAQQQQQQQTVEAR